MPEGRCSICNALAETASESLKDGAFQILFFQSDTPLYACSSRCLVTFALREYESHSDGMLSKARKHLETAQVIINSGGRGEAAIAEIDRARKSLWTIDHGKAEKKT